MNNLKAEAERLSASMDQQITHRIDVAAHLEAKMAAMRAHRTQFGAEHPFTRVPEQHVVEVFGREYFIQAFPPHLAAEPENMEQDLFSGLKA